MFSRSWRRLAPTTEDVVAAFKILGLAYNPRLSARGRPGVDDVRRQYREMARLHHPDLSSGDDNRMKIINTAYELIQSSGVLQGTDSTADGSSERAADTVGEQSAASSRFARKVATRRRRLPDDFASGDDSSWSMKTSLDWQAMMNSSDALSDEALKNPANHPFSHSKFFTIEDDLSIYRMIRGGATVRQVARTLGKPATFIERRLQNAQFKLRVQYILRQDKRKAQAATSSTNTGPAAMGCTTSAPVTEPTTRRALRRSPYEDPQPFHRSGSPGRGSGAAVSSSRPLGRKKEWQASYPEWRAPQYRDCMSLEEQGRLDGIVRSPLSSHPARDAANEVSRHGAASKMGRSYENYQRMQVRGRG